MIKRITALLLCVLMVFSISGYAFAEENAEIESFSEETTDIETELPDVLEPQQEDSGAVESIEEDLSDSDQAEENADHEDENPEPAKPEENEEQELKTVDDPAASDEKSVDMETEELPDKTEAANAVEEEQVEEDIDALPLGVCTDEDYDIGFSFEPADLTASSIKGTAYKVSGYRYVVANGARYSIPLADSNGNPLEGSITSCSSSDPSVVSAEIIGGKCIATSRKAGFATIVVANDKYTTQYSIISQFTDVTLDSTGHAPYYHAPVYWALNKGVTSGKTATTFGTNDGCTRGQIVTFIWKNEGSPSVPPTTINQFVDIKADDYFYNPVLWAYNQKITSGKTANTFAPWAYCTREQCVTFLWRYAGSPSVGTNNPFNDVPSNAYYAQAVTWAVNKGITSGKSSNFFGTGETCTRGQIVTFLWHANGH